MKLVPLNAGLDATGVKLNPDGSPEPAKALPVVSVIVPAGIWMRVRVGNQIGCRVDNHVITGQFTAA